MTRARVAGRGRAGTALVRALAQAGWEVDAVSGRSVPSGAAAGTDFLFLAVPDDDVATTASTVVPDGGCVVVHLSGALGLDALSPHPRTASLHPLVALTGPESANELVGAWMATSGDSAVAEVVSALGGRALPVPDAERVRYHSAAVVAANHLVALMGQVERIAAGAGLPLTPFLDLAAGALASVRSEGPSAALTGPVSRGDRATVQAHLESLDPRERDGYEALSRLAARLAGPPGERVWPAPVEVPR